MKKSVCKNELPAVAKEFIGRHGLNELPLELPLIEKDLIPVCMASLLISVHGEYECSIKTPAENNYD